MSLKQLNQFSLRFLKNKLFLPFGFAYAERDSETISQWLLLRKLLAFFWVKL